MRIILKKILTLNNKRATLFAKDILNIITKNKNYKVNGGNNEKIIISI